MKIGDRVKCTLKDSPFFDCKGTVSNPGSETCIIEFDNNKEIHSVHIQHLAVVGISNSAIEFLSRAKAIMQQRAQQYDKPDGERSMDATVKAFNAVTGRDLTESEGWLLMLILKNVRQWQKPEYHADSAEDSVAYSALLAEALAKGK